MKNIYLIPGFLASDLGILSTGQRIWWDTSINSIVGLGSMRLNPDGKTPAPPNGKVMGVDTDPQLPWPLVLAGLRFQLDPKEWRVAFGPYDWRIDITQAATDLAANIRRQSSAVEPATIVAHSMGGLIATLAWSILLAGHDENLVRRIITIGTPFQGSSGMIQWLNGSSVSIKQVLAVGLYPVPLTIRPFVNWSLDWLNALFLTWPAAYQLFPSLVGTDAAADPERSRLYLLGNYPDYAQPSQAWLDYARLTFQPTIANANTFPPSWVATYVYGTGYPTANKLRSTTVPLDLLDLAFTNSGDGVVTVGSATRSPGLTVATLSDHSSMPLAITLSGLLAKLIIDPRGPVDPPPPPVIDDTKYTKNVTDAPQADYVSGEVCLDGHCIRSSSNFAGRFVIGDEIP